MPEPLFSRTAYKYFKLSHASKLLLYMYQSEIYVYIDHGLPVHGQYTHISHNMSISEYVNWPE